MTPPLACRFFNFSMREINNFAALRCSPIETKMSVTSKIRRLRKRANHLVTDPSEPRQKRQRRQSVQSPDYQGAENAKRKRVLDDAASPMQRKKPNLNELSPDEFQSRLETGWNLQSLDEQRKYFLKMAQNTTNPSLRRRLCLFYAANCLEEQGKTQEAKAAYRKILRFDRNGMRKNFPLVVAHFVNLCDEKKECIDLLEGAIFVILQWRCEHPEDRMYNQMSELNYHARYAAGTFCCLLLGEAYIDLNAGKCTDASLDSFTQGILYLCYGGLCYTNWTIISKDLAKMNCISTVKTIQRLYQHFIHCGVEKLLSTNYAKSIREPTVLSFCASIPMEELEERIHLAFKANYEFTMKNIEKIYRDEYFPVAEYASVFANYGALMQDYLGKYDEAKKWYEKGLEFDPEDCILHSNLAELYEKEECWNKALEHYEMCCKFDQEDQEEIFSKIAKCKSKLNM